MGLAQEDALTRALRIVLNDITKPRKFRGVSSLKPKPILRIGIYERAIACLNIIKGQMSFKALAASSKKCRAAGALPRRRSL
jgi:hypothetical protein